MSRVGGSGGSPNAPSFHRIRLGRRLGGVRPDAQDFLAEAAAVGRIRKEEAGDVAAEGFDGFTAQEQFGDDEMRNIIFLVETGAQGGDIAAVQIANECLHGDDVGDFANQEAEEKTKDGADDYSNHAKPSSAHGHPGRDSNERAQQLEYMKDGENNAFGGGRVSRIRSGLRLRGEVKSAGRRGQRPNASAGRADSRRD